MNQGVTQDSNLDGVGTAFDPLVCMAMKVMLGKLLQSQI